MKYRTKPEFVEAFRWDGQETGDYPEWWNKAIGSGAVKLSRGKCSGDLLAYNAEASRPTRCDYGLAGCYAILRPSGLIAFSPAAIFEQYHEPAE